jgi:hypothetical protein
MKFVKLTLQVGDPKKELSIEDIEEKVKKAIGYEILEIYGAPTRDEIRCACQRSY